MAPLTHFVSRPDPFRFGHKFKEHLMDVIELPLGQIIPYARNPRQNEKAIATVAASIAEFGWRQPIVVDENMVILAGHTRLAAAQQLELKTPAARLICARSWMR